MTLHPRKQCSSIYINSRQFVVSFTKQARVQTQVSHYWIYGEPSSTGVAAPVTYHYKMFHSRQGRGGGGGVVLGAQTPYFPTTVLSSGMVLEFLATYCGTFLYLLTIARQQQQQGLCTRTCT
jgi:hypothetical protein